MKLNSIQLVEEHMIIRDTVGYDAISKVEIEDLPTVMEFLTIVWNYKKMTNILNTK